MSQASGFVDPPDIDRELDDEIVRDVVRGQFPQLAVHSVEYLDSGSSYDAYLVDGQLVFRFPRHELAAHDFDRQDRIHALVASAAGASVGIPKIVLWGTPCTRFPHRFAAHKLIPGVAAWDTSVPETPELADDLGCALTRIHAIPSSAAERIGVGEASETLRGLLDEWQQRSNELQQMVRHVPEIEELAPEACTWLRAGPVVPNDYRGVPRFVHSDFVPRHIIVSPTTGRLSGIIDWEPGLGDPAQDFSYLLFCRGWSFLQRTMAAYELPVDPAFRERTIFLARIRALLWLANAIRNRWDTKPFLGILRNTFATE
jgi:aminoglycoside 2''-phosphotransferase